MLRPEAQGPPRGRARSLHQLRGGLSELLGLVSGTRQHELGVFKDASEQRLSEDRERSPKEGPHVSEDVEFEVSRGSQQRLSSDELELIGRGAYGCVYRGLWEGRPAAIKIIEHDEDMLLDTQSETSSRDNPALSTYGSDGTGPFQSSSNMSWLEAALSCTIVHPNVVQTFTYYTGDPLSETRRATGIPIRSMQETSIVMEFCDGGSLDVAVDEGHFHLNNDPNAPIDLACICITLCEVASAVAFLHSKNILHRDLKAKNVLLTSCKDDPRGFVAKVSDFGLSVRMPEGVQTHVRSFCGTVSHMAPELMLDEIASPASDVYAFGILMWEIFCGGAPYGRLSKPQIMVGVGSEGLRPAFSDMTPAWYKELASSCWDADPQARPTCPELEQQLRERAAGLLKPDLPSQK